MPFRGFTPPDAFAYKFVLIQMLELALDCDFEDVIGHCLPLARRASDHSKFQSSRCRYYYATPIARAYNLYSYDA